MSSTHADTRTAPVVGDAGVFGPSSPPPNHRPGEFRRMAGAVLSVLLFIGGVTALSVEGIRVKVPAKTILTATRSASELARADASAFLGRYLEADGRVARWDQGGDTVSEGQAYAMLLAVATGQRAQFASAWQWEQQNLEQADGLFAFHWRGGSVVDQQPATDADLDTAWALVMASQRFSDPTYLSAGLRVGSAVLANETTTVAGHLELVAGPWAKGSPAVADPSYMAPEALGALANVTGDPRWTALATDSTALLATFAGAQPAQLPPNWVDIDPSGVVRPIGNPSGAGAPAYGLDAERVPVWYAAGCVAGERTVAADEWPTLARSAGHGGRISYSLSGQPSATDVNPVGLVAAASAAVAAGHGRTSMSLLAQADQQSARYRTYYGDAWVALGRILLDTRWLSPCAPAA